MNKYERMVKQYTQALKNVQKDGCSDDTVKRISDKLRSIEQMLKTQQIKISDIEKHNSIKLTNYIQNQLMEALPSYQGNNAFFKSGDVTSKAVKYLLSENVITKCGDYYIINNMPDNWKTYSEYVNELKLSWKETDEKLEASLRRMRSMFADFAQS